MGTETPAARYAYLMQNVRHQVMPTLALQRLWTVPCPARMPSAYGRLTPACLPQYMYEPDFKDRLELEMSVVDRLWSAGLEEVAALYRDSEAFRADWRSDSSRGFMSVSALQERLAGRLRAVALHAARSCPTWRR